MTDEEKELFVRSQNNDIEAINLIMKKYHGLIIYLSNKYSFNSSQYEENIQNGMIGLYLAIKKYNLDFNTKFISYAYPIVQNEIIRGKFAINPSISINAYCYIRYKAMNKYIDEYYEENGCKPTDKEIMEYLSWNLKTFKTINNLNYDYLPITFLENSKENFINEDELYYNTKSTEDIAIENIFMENVYNIIRKYTCEKYLTMYRLYYGLLDNKAYTYAEIGHIYRISSQAVKAHIDGVRKITKGPVLKYIKKCGISE